jgi:hypothetical protein
VQRRQPPPILSQLLYLQQWKSEKEVPSAIMPTHQAEHKLILYVFPVLSVLLIRISCTALYYFSYLTFICQIVNLSHRNKIRIFLTRVTRYRRLKTRELLPCRFSFCVKSKDILTLDEFIEKTQKLQYRISLIYHEICFSMELLREGLPNGEIQ